MAKASVKVSKRDMIKLQKQINKAIDISTEDTYEFFKQKTPVKGGNARRNTKYKEKGTKTTIIGDYPYSGILDDGYSKQAPRGMTKPSLNELEKVISKQFRKI
jgi:hypothetical protein